MTRGPVNAGAMRAIFDAAPDPYWIIDPASSAFLDANAEAEAQLGFSRDEILRIGVVDVNLAISSQEKWREITASIRLGETFRYLAELRCKSGGTVTVEITISRLAVEGREVFLAITRDVAHIQAIEAELRDREHLLQAVFRTMTEGVLVVDAQHGCKLWNSQFARMLGRDGQQTISQADLVECLALPTAEPLSEAQLPTVTALQSGAAVSEVLLSQQFGWSHERGLVTLAHDCQHGAGCGKNDEGGGLDHGGSSLGECDKLTLGQPPVRRCSAGYR